MPFSLSRSYSLFPFHRVQPLSLATFQIDRKARGAILPPKREAFAPRQLRYATHNKRTSTKREKEVPVLSKEKKSVAQALRARFHFGVIASHSLILLLARHLEGEAHFPLCSRSKLDVRDSKTDITQEKSSFS